jgi:hypothetical protein
MADQSDQEMPLEQDRVPAGCPLHGQLLDDPGVDLVQPAPQLNSHMVAPNMSQKA